MVVRYRVSTSIYHFHDNLCLKKEKNDGLVKIV